MNKAVKDLWQRIQDFQIDDVQAIFPFSLKLAKEEGWDIAFAAEAIVEYKKYAFLSCVLPNTSPSPIIDKVWHMHLLYTKQYWQVWCATILKKELHHSPVSGDKMESTELQNAYKNTQHKYKELFGYAPPKKFWS